VSFARFLIALASALCAACAASPPRYTGVPEQRDFPFRLALLGRTAAGNGHPDVAARILRAVASEKPVFVLHTGALVAGRPARRVWDDFDRIGTPLIEADAPLFPVPGPGDLGGSEPPFRRAWRERFWSLDERRWFAFRHKNLMVVGLDTNLDDLGRRWKDQRDWLQETLRKADLEANVNLVIVLMHHAPYTNGKTAHARRLLRTFVPVLERSRKVRWIFSGASGAYERIRRDGKGWITTGGGGGKRTPVECDPPKRRFIDGFRHGPLRPFHYLRLTVEPTRFTLEMVALKDDGESFQVLDKVVEGKP